MFCVKELMRIFIDRYVCIYSPVYWIIYTKLTFCAFSSKNSSVISWFIQYSMYWQGFGRKSQIEPLFCIYSPLADYIYKIHLPIIFEIFFILCIVHYQIQVSSKINENLKYAMKQHCTCIILYVLIPECSYVNYLKNVF